MMKRGLRFGGLLHHQCFCRLPSVSSAIGRAPDLPAPANPEAILLARIKRPANSFHAKCVH